MQERSEMQQRQGYQAVEKLRETLDEKYLWEVILLYAGESFKTYTGLPFTYEVRKGRNGTTQGNCGSTVGRTVRVWR